MSLLDDADHRDQQYAIEAIGSVHDVLDVAHLVAVADGFPDTFDIDLRPGRDDRRDACRRSGSRASFTPSATMNAVLHSATKPCLRTQPICSSAEKLTGMGSASSQRKMASNCWR